MACLARDGHEVVGVDIDPRKLDLIRSGLSPIVEEGIQELTQSVVGSGRVTVTSDVTEAIVATDLCFVCVGTPSSTNGSQDLAAIRRVFEMIGAALKGRSSFYTVVLRSTVQPGTVSELMRPTLERLSGKRADSDFGICFQPEFLREGTSIRDYDNPPLTIVGSACERSVETLRGIFGHLPCEFVVTDIGTAEMQKYACNAFHAVKITFANEIGRLSQSVGVDGREVMKLICKDKRLNISPAYLRPGFAFGGSCLPKDLRAITYIGKQRDVTTPMLGAVMASNRVHVDHVLDRLMTPGVRRIGMIGLSFKTGTDDLRESPLVTVAERLIGKGYDLRIYDPEVNLSRLIGANKRFIEESIPHIGALMSDSCEAVLEHATTILVGMATPPVIGILQKHLMDKHRVVDVVGMQQSGMVCAEYIGACW